MQKMGFRYVDKNPVDFVLILKKNLNGFFMCVSVLKNCVRLASTGLAR